MAEISGVPVDDQRRMIALDEFLSRYEAEHGEIADDEIRDASRNARSRATAVRPATSD